MTTFTTGAGLKSAPYTVPRGAIVTVTAAAGASATVESTSANAADVANNIAVWTAWPKGLVSGAPASLLATDNMSVRVNAVGGVVTCDIDENPSARALAAFRSDWSSIPTPLATPLPVASVSGPASNLTIGPNYQTNGATVANYPMAMSMPEDFSGVRLIFMNHQSAAATVDDHAVAASSTAYPGGSFNINNPEGDWVAAGAPVVIPAAKGATQAERDKRPGMILGPVLPVRSIPRAAGELDGGKFPLLFTRIYSAVGNAAMPLGNEVVNFQALYDPVNNGMSILTSAPITSGNFTTSNQRGYITAIARQTQPIFACFGAVPTYDKAVTVVMGLGDSIMAGGADGGSARTPFLFRAVSRLRASGKRVAYYNGAISGSAMDSITIRGKDMFDLFQPNIVMLASYSVNNNAGNTLSLTTQAGWDANWFQMMEMVRTIHAAGKIAVIETPLPFGTFTPTQNAFRLKQRQRVIDSGLPYVDFEFFADSGGRWADPADTSDGTHLSQAGHEKATGPVEALLNTLIA